MQLEIVIAICQNYQYIFSVMLHFPSYLYLLRLSHLYLLEVVVDWADAIVKESDASLFM